MLRNEAAARPGAGTVLLECHPIARDVRDLTIRLLSARHSIGKRKHVALSPAPGMCLLETIASVALRASRVWYWFVDWRRVN